MENYKVINYKNGDSNIEIVVIPFNHTAWISKSELAKLFNISIRTINMHLYKLNEAKNRTSDKTDSTSDKNVATREPTRENFSLTRIENGRKIARKIKHYSIEIVTQLDEKYRSKNGFYLMQFLNNYFDQSINNLNEIIIYDNGYVRIPLEVSKTQQTIWATQE